MVIPVEQTTRRIEVQHPVLSAFNEEFGTESDLSRYENIRSNNRATSEEAFYLNQLQMDSYIPTRLALLLKNNLHDSPFITFTTRSILYTLNQQQKIGNACFNFLHEKVNAGDFLTVFKYLYILMLYSKIAEQHDAQVADPAFRFVSPARYSDKLIKCQTHVLQKEEQNLQEQFRKQFLRQSLTEIASRPNCPIRAQQEIFQLIATIDSSDYDQFRSKFLIFLEKLQNAPELEAICWKEFQEILSPFTGKSFFEQTYLRLKTERYYKNCLARVVTLKQSLENTNNPDLQTISEQCKKAYNGCIYLLGDNKNMAACSPMRFAALTGKMRTELLMINNVFNRAQQQFSHRLCNCQVQTPSNQNELAEWPFNTHTLLNNIPPAPPVPMESVRDPSAYRGNQNNTIAIFGCEWGGGHKAIAGSAVNYLTAEGYHPVTINLPEVLISEDPIRNLFITRWLGKKWSVETLCNGLAAHKAYSITNLLRKYGESPPDPAQEERMLKLVLEHLLKINPQAVMITYNAHNETVIKACKILGIPCIHISSDIDTSVTTRSSPPDYDHFKMSIPFNEKKCIDPTLQVVRPDQRFVSGPPVRHEFTLPRTAADICQLKQKWGIGQDKKVIVMTNGANGSSSPFAIEELMKKYAHSRQEDIPIHLVVLCGKDNHNFKNYLEQQVMPNTKIPMHVELLIPPDKMEEALSMAAFGGGVVGKCGGGTLFECYVRGTRILVDNVKAGWFSQGYRHFFITLLSTILKKIGIPNQLPWEKINSQDAIEKGLADTFKEEKEFIPKLEQMLNNDGLPVRLDVEVKNFRTELMRNLHEMIVKANVHLDTRRSHEIVQNL